MPSGGRGKSRRPGPLLREAKPDGARSGGPCPHFWGSEASMCCPRARAVRDAAAVCAAGPERSVLLDPHGRCVEVLIIRVSKRDFMWKKGLYRGNRANPQGQCGRRSRRRRKAARWLECRVCKAQNAEDRPRERPGVAPGAGGEARGPAGTSFSAGPRNFRAINSSFWSIVTAAVGNQYGDFPSRADGGRQSRRLAPLGSSAHVTCCVYLQHR